MRSVIAFAILCVFAYAPAQARTHHVQHHHYSHHRHFDGDQLPRSGITRARLADGQTISVSSAHASQFVGFLNALYYRYGSLPRVTCLASGHMPNSLHHWGGACDVGQTARNVAWRAMYHIGSLASSFGLTDGCIWRNPDCGHVQVGGYSGQRYARRYWHHRYAGHRRTHYAGA